MTVRLIISDVQLIRIQPERIPAGSTKLCRKSDLGQVDNLTGLGSRNHSLEVCVLAAFAGPFFAFGNALKTPLLFLLLFLSAGTFSLAFFHRFWLCERDVSAGQSPDSIQLGERSRPSVERCIGLGHQTNQRSRAGLMTTSDYDRDPHHHRFDRGCLRRSSTRAAWPHSP